MATIAEFIQTQFKKAGVTITAEIEETLKNESLSKINLNDVQVKDVNDKLMTLEVAKENPVLKQHFKQQSLNPIDTKLDDKLISEYEISDDLAAAIRAEKNTYEKIELWGKAIKQLQEKKSSAAVGDKAGYIKQIDELRNEILSEKAKAKAETDRLQNETKEKEKNWNIRGHFAGYNYSDQYDKSDAIELAMINLNKQLAQDGAKVILDPTGGLKLVNASDESLEFTREHQKVSFKDYTDKLVADKKLIKTAETKPVNSQQNQNSNQNNNLNNNNNNNNFNRNEEPNVAQQDILLSLKDMGVNVNQ